MQRCTSCGRWGGRPGENCPHCGKACSAEPPTTDLVTEFVEENDDDMRRFLDDDSEPAPPSPAQLQAFIAKQQKTRAPAAPPATATQVLQPLDIPALDPVPPAAPAAAPAPRNVPVVAPLAAPVVQPILEPVLEPITSDVVLPLPVVAPAPAFAADALDVTIRAAIEHASLPQADEPLVNVLVSFTPDGPSALDASQGPVAHLVLALDVSASMNHADKYPVLTEAISGMLYDLRKPGAADVLLSVVVYAYGAETIFRDVPASTLDPREVLRRIDRSALRFGRYTDVVGALSRAGRIAYDSIQRDRRMPVRICLLTDGRPQDMDGARTRMATIAKMPVDVDGLAFGADADVAALQELVSGGRGGTVKVVRPDTLGEAFGRIAEVAAAVVTNRALVEVELRPGVVGGAAFRHRPGRHKFGDAAFEEGRTFRTDLGTLESGREYSLLFQVRLPETTANETEVGRVTLRIPTPAGPRLFEHLVSVPRHEGASLPEADPVVQAARDVLVAIGKDDPAEQLRALRVRRKLYEAERRDPQLLAAIDRAIQELEEHGSLKALPVEQQAAILSHTCTVGSVRGGAAPKPRSRELAV